MPISRIVRIQNQTFRELEDGTVVYAGDLCPLREAHWYKGTPWDEARVQDLERRVRRSLEKYGRD